MTPEEQRIAIAEWCGWRRGVTFESQDVGPSTDIARDTWLNPQGQPKRSLPDFLNDLNAIHEAEGFLGDRRGAYEDWLVAICHGLRRSIYATAAQRAEALLRTIGKWEEKK